MNIELHSIPVKDIIRGYVDNEEEGVFSYDGRLNIRPKYQREFVYDNTKRSAVIDTLFKGFPLNVMYWNVNTKDNTYEVIDGQQRTISICQYAIGYFPIALNGMPKYFHNLNESEKQRFLNYELMIYFCEGTPEETLAWFKIINIAGEELTPQELRNASYTGTWLTDAKRIFSKTGGAGARLSSRYVNGEARRQAVLERAIDWISKGHIEEYMAQHQNDPSCAELWLYFQNVINWIPTVFSHYRREMRGLPWGPLYDTYHTNMYDPVAIENRITELMIDSDVTKKSGIYQYILSGDEKYLNIRVFDEAMKRSAYERQNGICPNCGNHFNINEMEGDHIIPWSHGGKTTPDNCRMLCRNCNRHLGNR